MKKFIINRKASVDKNYCVACGECKTICPLGAISIHKGIYSEIDLNKCVGCGKCAKSCPASAIEIIQGDDINEM